MVDETARHRIRAALDEVERDHRVRIIFAVESGSRAWGHPSPDSDYDVRFVYRRPRDSYLTIGKRSDVLELGLRDDLDLAGWDIDKTLRLLIGGNPSILEWLASPIVYVTSPWQQHLEALADLCPHRRASFWHYSALARRQRELLGGDGPVKLKRYFYVIRPALAVAWLEQHGVDTTRVPMALPRLLQQVELPYVVRTAIDGLLERKAVTSELGTGPRIAAIDDFVARQLDGYTVAPPKEQSPDLLAEADKLFRQILAEGDVGGG